MRPARGTGGGAGSPRAAHNPGIMATSVVGAVIDLYNSINAAHFGGTRPPIFLGEAAQTTTTGAQQRVPYVVLYDDGIVPTFDSSYGGVEAGAIRLEVFALKVAAVGEVTLDSIVAGMKYGGTAPSAKLGLDFGAFTLTGYRYKISLRRTREQYSYAGFTTQGPNGETARVHKCALAYRIVTGLSPS